MFVKIQLELVKQCGYIVKLCCQEVSQRPGYLGKDVPLPVFAPFGADMLLSTQSSDNHKQVMGTDCRLVCTPFEREVIIVI